MCVTVRPDRSLLGCALEPPAHHVFKKVWRRLSGGTYGAGGRVVVQVGQLDGWASGGLWGGCVRKLGGEFLAALMHESSVEEQNGSSTSYLHFPFHC